MEFIKNKKTGKEFRIDRIYLNGKYNLDLLNKVKIKYDTVISFTEDEKTDSHFIISEKSDVDTKISFYRNASCAVKIGSTYNMKDNSEYKKEYESFVKEFFDWLEEMK